MRKWFSMPVAAHLILEKNDSILLLLRDGTGYEDGKYSVVAGHFEGNESGVSAMIRETEEEAGIKIEREWLSLACVVHRKAPDRESIDFFYSCKTWTGNITNREPHKCKELVFFSKQSMPENIIEYVKCAIEAYLSGEKYVEYGWENCHVTRS